MITSKENKREISYILYTSGILISTYKIDVPGKPSKYADSDHGKNQDRVEE